VLNLMFVKGQPALNNGFHLEHDLWDFKKDCPKMGKEHANAWADLAKEMLGMHNNDGGILIFGMSDSYTFVGARNRLDSKQLNDGLRRYLSDRLWVDFHREFIREDQSYLGIALVPPRGATFERFTAAAPAVNGKVVFVAGWSAIRRKDSTYLLTPQETDELDRSRPIPIVGRQYQIDEPYYRILQPDYLTFVTREEPCAAIQAGIADERVAVVSIVGIGGIGKTALATWAVLKAYHEKRFQFIASITAKDRELTEGGIRAVRPGLTSFEALLNNTLDIIGFPELKALEDVVEKERQLRELLRETKGLLYVDNVETVDDARILNFLNNLPLGIKAIVTSRRASVRRLIVPVDLHGLSDNETSSFIASLAERPPFAYATQLNAAERLRIGKACDNIPLAIRWVLSRSRHAAEAISNADSLGMSSKHGEVLLEFSFRRVFEGMLPAEQRTLEVLSLFQKALSTEALLVGSGLAQTVLDDALETLSQDALIERAFNPETNDYVFSLNAIPRSFVQSEFSKKGSLSNSIRAKLTKWYEATDISDDDTRLTVRDLRQGRLSPELALLDLAKAADRTGDTQSARGLYEQALIRVPNSWRAAWEYAEFFRHRLHDRTGALRLYERAAANAPRRGADKAVIFREYGILLRESGDYNATDSAIEKFEIALTETPNDPITIWALSSMLERKGHYAKIIRLLEPLKNHSNPKSREKCHPLLLKAYEHTGDILGAAELRLLAQAAE
jgi:tetratricopeptide (TPR) repeat protein